MNFGFLVIVPLFFQDSDRIFYIFVKCFPFFRMVHKILRTDLARHIIMTDDIVRLQIKLNTEVRAQIHQRLICTVIKFSGLVRMTALDGDRVAVPVVGGVGDLIERNTLYHFSLKSAHKMAAG